MPIKMSGRYPEGSEQERAHKLLKEHDVDCDHVYGVAMLESGQEEITFTWNGKAQTAFCRARARRARDGGLGRAAAQAGRRYVARRLLSFRGSFRWGRPCINCIFEGVKSWGCGVRPGPALVCRIVHA